MSSSSITNTKLCLTCGVPATHKCSRCDDAWYCSKEHQREHWRTHKRTTCLCAHGKKMYADIRAESSFPLWIQYQFDSGREFYDMRRQQMIREFRQNTNPSILSGVNRPIPFTRVRREALANLSSHDWPDMPLYGDFVSTRCNTCQAKFVHAAAYYQCGQTPPRTQS